MNEGVLLISDDVPFRESLEPALSAASFEVRMAKCLFTSFPVILPSNPKVIFTDYTLNDGRACDLLAWLKGTERRVPVISFSSTEEREFEAIAISHGATRAITKQIDIDHLTYDTRLVEGRSTR